MMMPIHTLRREQVLDAPPDALAHRLIVRRDLEAIFAYRARRVPGLLS